MGNSCGFCGITYDPSKRLEFKRERHEELVPGMWTQLRHGVDDNGQFFIFARGENDSERYYPKFCPECGRRIL